MFHCTLYSTVPTSPLHLTMGEHPIYWKPKCSKGEINHKKVYPKFFEYEIFRPLQTVSQRMIHRMLSPLIYAQRLSQLPQNQPVEQYENCFTKMTY